MDVSFSMYRRLSMKERIRFLDIMLRSFIDKRYNIYNEHGYSASTIQVRKDFEKHKSQENFANEKFRNLLEHFDYRDAPVETGSKTFCFIDDAAGRNSLEQLQLNGATWYAKCSNSHQGKHADVIFRIAVNYYICEAKHLKEAGGGQDKQITELISFINNREHQHGRKNVFYVSFLDGVYFNKFASARRGKIYEQKTQIKNILADEGLNYFVSTYGLSCLLNTTWNAGTRSVENCRRCNHRSIQTIL